jgi:hypothetical protein
MGVAKTTKTEDGGSIKRILAVVAPLVAFVVLAFITANHIAGRALLIAYPDLETTYQGARPTWSGDVVVSDITVTLAEGDNEPVLRYDRAVVRTPGWWWYARMMLARKRSKAPDLDEFGVRFEGLQSPEGIDPTLGSLGVFGAMSAAPFEAEGCVRDSRWTSAQLIEMGLKPGPTSVDIDWKAQGRLLTTTHTLHTPGVSQAIYVRTENMALGRPNLLVLDYAGESEMMSERWEVEDEGFVMARNAYCARQGGVDERTFVSRHMAATARVLESEGMAVSRAAADLYRDYARRGGKIAMGGTYQTTTSFSDYVDMDWVDSLRRIGARVEYRSRSAPVAWERIDVRAFANEDRVSTYAAMIEEGSLPLGLAGRDAPVLERRLIALGQMTEAEATEPATADGLLPPAATGPASAPTPQTATASAPSSTSKPLFDPLAAAQAPTPTPTPTSAPVVSTPAAPASGAAGTTTSPAPTTAPSTVSSATSAAAPTQLAKAEPAADPLPAARPRTQPSRVFVPAEHDTVVVPPEPEVGIAYADLPRYIGRNVRVTLSNGTERVATLEQVNAKGLQLRVRMGGGWATFEVAREDVRLVQRR